jgi:hypothetical protein
MDIAHPFQKREKIGASNQPPGKQPSEWTFNLTRFEISISIITNTGCVKKITIFFHSQIKIFRWEFILVI